MPLPNTHLAMAKAGGSLPFACELLPFSSVYLIFTRTRWEAELCGILLCMLLMPMINKETVLSP